MFRKVYLAFIISFTTSALFHRHSLYGMEASKTIPSIYVDTKDRKEIQSKDQYVDATFYIVSYGYNGYNDIGSSLAPLKLQIRGRGNWTWTNFEKKSYKIKLGGANNVLGMKKEKHYALLAHADDPTGFFRNTIGFEISRLLNMPFTPEQRPVELILNGEYLGLYFLTETIRISPSRLDLLKQNDYETDPEKVKGGWLVELDNYRDENQIVIDVTNTPLDHLWITYHDPGNLSFIQYDYLKSEFQRLFDVIYSPVKKSEDLEKIVDIESLCMYCIIAEITSHQEAFVGSCYLYKNYNEDKWSFGPVWDFGSSLTSYQHGYMYQDNYFGETIMTELAKFDCVQNCIRKLWPIVRSSVTTSKMDVYIDNFSREIEYAAVSDYNKWPQYGHPYILQNAEWVKNMLYYRIDWLDEQWGENTLVKDLYCGDRKDFAIYDIKGILLYNSNNSLLSCKSPKDVIKKLGRGFYIVKTKEKAYLFYNH